MSRDFTVIGRALAAPARSAIIGVLMDGSARPAGELASAAAVSAPAASEHLAVLVDAGLLSCTARGRQRFYRIADPTVAAGLEHIGRLCPEQPVHSLRQSRQQRDLSKARRCYDHLAGRLGVALTDAYLERGWVNLPELEPTAAGERVFAELGVDLPGLRVHRRRLTRSCLDWTQRRPHLAGSLGAALAELFEHRQWVRSSPAGRGLTITPDGVEALRSTFGVVLPAA